MIKQFGILFVLIFITGCVVPDPIIEPKDPPPIVENKTNETNTDGGSVIPIPTPHPGNLTFYFLDVDQGDATLVVTPSGTTLLYDGGKKKWGPEIVSFIRNLGMNEIDYVVASHPDADHIGGLVFVNQKLSPLLVIDNGITKDTQIYKEYKDSITEHIIIYIDSQFDFDDEVIASFIVPFDDGDGYSSNGNDNSLIMRFDYKDSSFLLTGDCEEDCEARIGDSDLDVDVYKVGHHGSKTASTMFLLNKVTPDISIISSEPSTYGHPHEEVLSRLNFVDTEIYRTDEKGHITITTDGDHYSILTTR